MAKLSLILAAALISTIFVSGPPAFADKAADKLTVDTACTADAATAKCGNEKVGTGLLKCIHAYKKANPSYQVSQSCKDAMKALHADH